MFRWVLVVTICLFSSLSALAEWSYDAVEDKMGGGKVFTAELRSTNTLRFGYPYEGGQKATLLLRKHPRYGIEAILSVPRGQFMCSAGGHNCMVLISFDGGRPTSYTVALPSDYSTNALFVRGAPSLVRRLPRTRTVRLAHGCRPAVAPASACLRAAVAAQSALPSSCRSS